MQAAHVNIMHADRQADWSHDCRVSTHVLKKIVRCSQNISRDGERKSVAAVCAVS